MCRREEEADSLRALPHLSVRSQRAEGKLEYLSLEPSRVGMIPVGSSERGTWQWTMSHVRGTCGRFTSNTLDSN